MVCIDVRSQFNGIMSLSAWQMSRSSGLTEILVVQPLEWVTAQCDIVRMLAPPPYDVRVLPKEEMAHAIQFKGDQC